MSSASASSRDAMGLVDGDNQHAVANAWPLVPVSMIAMAMQLAFADSSIVMAASIVFYAYYVIAFIRSAGGVSNPIAFTLIVALFYTYLPFLPGQEFDYVTEVFGLEGGYKIMAVADCSLVTAIYLSNVLFKAQTELPARSVVTDWGIEIATNVSLGVSCVLTMLYILRFGVVASGEVDYEYSFMQRQEAGAGILMLGVPFGLLTAALAFTRGRITIYRLAAGCAPFALLLLATGQRKYIIMPALTFVAAQVKLRSMYRIAVFVVAIFLGMFVFGFLGFLRINNYTIYDAFDAVLLQEFLANIGQYVSGETPTLLATASSAYQGFMDPLPFFGDYLRAWEMSVPQFLVGLTYISANDRFTFAITPEFASLGGGWGYSFFAEAFMVGGYPGVFVATTAVAVFFRYLYRLALAGGRNSVFYALMVCGNYHAIWFERNSFAFFLKEYLIYQTAVAASVFAIARAASLFRPGRS